MYVSPTLATLDILLTEVSDSHEADRAAIAEALALRQQTPGHLDTGRMAAFCAAGDKMMHTNIRKVAAIKNLKLGPH